MRADHWEKQNWDNHLKTFVTPFWPAYRPSNLKSNDFLGGKTADFSHEREWRVPHDFSFGSEQVAFVVLNTYEDMAAFPRDLKDAIGRDKFLLMENYNAVEKLWPVHNL